MKNIGACRSDYYRQKIKVVDPLTTKQVVAISLTLITVALCVMFVSNAKIVVAMVG